MADLGLKAKDFKTDQEVRWCPGCGDYSILAQVQKIMPGIGVPKENIVIISGIGCSSRFPYYMNTYGMHSIHGRATAVATGLKASRPELSVWIVTGDGDSLSIGGNHTIHLLRRNLDVNILLFNNQIYGLTKGQYSPTSEQKKITKSTPFGSIDHPFNPLALAMGADATFIGRSMDRDPKHLQTMLTRSHQHKGASFLEIYQNCNIFNDGAFDVLKEPETRDDYLIRLEHGEPIKFGAGGTHVVTHPAGSFGLAVGEAADTDPADVLVHDAHAEDPAYAFALSRLADPDTLHHTPIGVFRSVERPVYDTLMSEQLDTAIEQNGKGDLGALLAGGDTWTVVG